MAKEEIKKKVVKKTPLKKEETIVKKKPIKKETKVKEEIKKKEIIEEQEEKKKKRKWLILLLLIFLCTFGIGITFGKDIYKAISDQIIEVLDLYKPTAPVISGGSSEWAKEKLIKVEKDAEAKKGLSYYETIKKKHEEELYAQLSDS